MNINGFCHDGVVQKTQPKLAFDEKREFFEWKVQVKEKIIEKQPKKEKLGFHNF